MSWQVLFGIGVFFLLTGACCTVWGVAAAVVLAWRLIARRWPGRV